MRSAGVAVAGRHQPFQDAAIVEYGAVARGRREDTPTLSQSRRLRADPGVVRKPLLTN